MAERLAFLSKAYSAYYHRGMPPMDDELTRVGPGTPCGEYLRRFWQPIVVSNELGDVPKRLKILGEDLVAFRDGSGEIGLVELHCPHRGTSLEFGLIESNGIRCCYHGWLFGCNGAILEAPGSRPTARSRTDCSTAPTRYANTPDWSSPIWGRRISSPHSQSSTPSPCLDTRWSRARRASGNATGCRSRKTRWTRRISSF